MMSTGVDARAGAPSWLLLAAAFGMLVPNVMFVHWLVVNWPGVAALRGNELALALLLDAFLATGVLAWHFARKPAGPVRWPVFVALSILGGLGFGVPFWLWLNLRKRA